MRPEPESSPSSPPSDTPPPPRLTGQAEDVVAVRPAVSERRGDGALGPQSVGAQLVHPDAGVQGEVAGPDPVVGGRGDDDADPARAAGRAADDLPAHERHGAAVRLLRTEKPDFWLSKLFKILFPPKKYNLNTFELKFL